MNKTSSHDDFCIFKGLSFFSFSVGYTSNVKYNYQRFVSSRRWSSHKVGSVIIFIDSVLNKTRQNLFKDMRFMLSVNIWYILQDSFKVWTCFFLDCAHMKQIRLSSTLILSKQTYQSQHWCVIMNGFQMLHENFDFLIILILYWVQ